MLRKGGYPIKTKADEKKLRVIYTRLTLREREALDKLAYIEGRQLSETLRELVRSEARRRGIWIEPTVTHE